MADHPHARGENFPTCQETSCKAGPSPRAWGELTQSRDMDWTSRTIPTRVGRTSRGVKLTERAPDHPHARGENLFPHQLAARYPGPSPRAWGEHRRRAASLLMQRTIPTRVGRTSPRPALRPILTDHPHARGENLFHASPATAIAGPSPRAWGEQEPGPQRCATPRTIPTRVGRTAVMPHVRVVSPDHPHARGENLPICSHKTLFPGPSPRAWGERAAVVFTGNKSRTIPTRVGRTPQRHRWHAQTADHPHARGENFRR